jgi:hypothetical protein
MKQNFAAPYMGILGYSKEEQIGAAIVALIGKDKADPVILPWYDPLAVVTGAVNVPYVQALEAAYATAKAQGYTTNNDIVSSMMNNETISADIADAYLQVIGAGSSLIVNNPLDDLTKTVSSPVTSILKELKWVLIPAAVIAGLYYGNQFIPHKKRMEK